MKPKLLTTLQDYSSRLFLSDLLAGVTVALVALPLSIAIAIASGATPRAGLVTAIIGGLLISLLGGSRVQIGGPTGCSSPPCSPESSWWRAGWSAPAASSRLCRSR